MYNILVVDDEIMVCRGISLILSQSALPLGDILIAQNGFEALDLIRLERIDLVITDIQMEQMNGIELMETIFLENPAIPVLVLSAHGEFEYAQKAMKFGAKEYIVKPVRPDHLITIVGKALQDRETMLRSVEKEELARKYQLQEKTSGGPGVILPELVFEGTDEREALELLAGLGYRELEERFSLLLVKPDLKKGGRTDLLITSLRDRKLMKYACRNVVEETVKEWKPLVFDLSTGLLAAILQLNEQDALYAAEGSRAATIAQKVHNNLAEYLNVDNVIGISGVGVGIGSWPELYRDAERALNWHQVHDDHYVFYSGDFAPSVIAEDVQADAPAEKREDAKRQSDVRRVISEAKAYIDQNFRTKGLKLQDIAGTVHLSPNYLCYLFKKDLGLNMWDYVTECRMEEGKRLVLTTDMRRYEIADEVGYETPEHFSKIFKRHFGVNLSEFKK
ncbi:MAG: response regulator [Gorillibacterium sp.]|nr:response regulator [Gorillibacterium sp.]